MADDKLTDRVELAETPNDNDFFYVVDVSDPTDDVTGSSKKIKYSNFKNSGTGSAERVELEVRFDEAVAKGDPVYITGFNLGQNRITVAKADSADSAKMPSIGLAGDSYLLNDNGIAITMGSLVDVNTASFSEGDVLYVDSGGGLTANKVGGSKLIQNVGKVGRSQSVNGEIVVMAIGRTNDVPNLPNGKFFIGSSNNTVESAYTLPTTDGAANQVLQTDGSGAVTFQTISGGSGLTALVDDTNPQLGGDLDLNGNNIDGAGNIDIEGGFSMFADGGTESDKFTVTTHEYAFSDENEDPLYDYNATDGHKFHTSGSERVNIKQNGGVELKGEVYADAELNNGNSSTAITIDWTSKNYQKVTLTDTCVFTFTAPNGVTTLILKLTQDATGSRTVTFPASVLWSGGTAPTLTTDANAVDLISFYYDGTNYIGGFLSDVK